MKIYFVILILISSIFVGCKQTHSNSKSEKESDLWVFRDPKYKLNIDSLKNKLQEQNLPDIERANAYILTGKKYFADNNFDSAENYFIKGLNFSRDIEYASAVYTAENGLAMVYIIQNVYDTAAVYAEKSLAHAKQSGDSVSMANIYNTIGVVCTNQNNYKQAISNYIECTKIADAINNAYLSSVATSNIGSLYFYMQNYEEAEKYWIKAASDFEKLDEKQLVAQNNISLCNLYSNQKRYDKSLEFAEKAYQQSLLINDSLNIASSLIALSASYLFAYNNNQKALEYANESMNIIKKNGYKQLLGFCNKRFFDIYFSVKDYKKAKIYGEKILSEPNTDNMNKISTNEKMIKIYIHFGEEKKAEQCVKNISELNRKISNESLHNAIREAEVKYQTEKKDLQIQNLNSQKRQMLKFNIAGSVAILFLLISLFLFTRYQRQRQMRMNAQIEKIEREKELIAAKSLLDGETNERIRLSRDIHDGLGGLLTMEKLSLEQLRKIDKISVADIDKNVSIIKKAIDEMHRLVHNMMPESLSKFGLRTVLEEYCFASKNVNFHFYGQEKRLPNEIETNIYRIACELINNALKHSGASNIDVQMIFNDTKLSLAVQDNGKGFDTSVVGHGLDSVRSRAKIIGAKLSMFSKKDKGSEITIELPIT